MLIIFCMKCVPLGCCDSSQRYGLIL